MGAIKGRLLREDAHSLDANHPVVWLTGHSGAGKTTLARAIQRVRSCVIMLDGDEMRESISLGSGFSHEERAEHNRRVARLAVVLARQMSVVVAVIAPMAAVRVEIHEICQPRWFYLKRTLPEREGHFYEEPKKEVPFTVLDMDHLTISQATNQVTSVMFAGKEKPE